jgi:hypothetical protein
MTDKLREEIDVLLAHHEAAVRYSQTGPLCHSHAVESLAKLKRAGDAVFDFIAQREARARAEAIEDAAKAVEHEGEQDNLDRYVCRDVAAVIRALKEK